MDDQKNSHKIKYKIDHMGSLGLLAYGDIGLRAWRKVRAEYEKENKSRNEKKA